MKRLHIKNVRKLLMGALVFMWHRILVRGCGTWSPTRSSATVIAQQASIPGRCRVSSRRRQRAEAERARPFITHGTRARRHTVGLTACQPDSNADAAPTARRCAPTSFAGLQWKCDWALARLIRRASFNFHQHDSPNCHYAFNAPIITSLHTKTSSITCW